ncbi:MAG: amidohydrolase family protein [SAR202 cluster bacterium]|nr:amidohydrolase family protein [SAR202 cluster bacterium]
MSPWGKWQKYHGVGGGNKVPGKSLQRYALVPDQIWDGTADQPLSNTAVVVDETLVDAVIPLKELPTDLERVTLEGCTLIPGLIDAHVHYSPVMGAAMLAGGVTTIRDVGNDLEWIINQRSINGTHGALGPTILCCGHLHDGPEVYWPRMGWANPTPSALRSSIQRHASAGVNAIKLYDGLTPDLFAVAVDESHKHNLFVTAHLVKTSIEEAAAVGVDGVEHLSRCDVAWREAEDEEDDILIDILLKHGVSLDPTIVVWDRLGRIMEHAFTKDRRREWVHPTHLYIWDNYRTRLDSPDSRRRQQISIGYLKRFLRRANEAGLTIGLGTDTPFPHLVPGFSVHDELAMYVDAGFTPVDALRSATSVNARILGVQSTLGQIAPGMVADLVAMNGNPLERIDDVGNVEMVIRSGELLSRGYLLEITRDSFGEGPVDPVTQDLLEVTDAGPKTE